MLNPLFRKSNIFLHLALLSSTRRFTSSMAAATASSPQAFNLDHTIFNPTFYARIRTFWFQGLPPNATANALPALQRWYGVGSTAAQKAAFDDECRELAAPALQSLAPDRLALPPFKSYDDEIENAATLAAPLLAEVQKTAQEDHSSSAGAPVTNNETTLTASPASLTLLSLLLLLDQFPRNIHRHPPGLNLVYTHYDRLAFALFHAAHTRLPQTHTDAFFRARPVYYTWLFMPLLHSEHLPSHALARAHLTRCKKECEAVGDGPAVETLVVVEGFYESHAEPLRRFGRYPHRNAFVGRKNTGEEEVYLETADTFGVVRAEKKGQAEGEKSEL